MAQLIVRNLDETVKAGLRRRALRHKRSMEEEARDILRKAVTSSTEKPKKLGTWLAGLFSEVGLKGPIKELRGQFARPAKFK